MNDCCTRYLTPSEPLFSMSSTPTYFTETTSWCEEAPLWAGIPQHSIESLDTWLSYGIIVMSYLPIYGDPAVVFVVVALHLRQVDLAPFRGTLQSQHREIPVSQPPRETPRRKSTAYHVQRSPIEGKVSHRFSRSGEGRKSPEESACICIFPYRCVLAQEPQPG